MKFLSNTMGSLLVFSSLTTAMEQEQQGGIEERSHVVYHGTNEKSEFIDILNEEMRQNGTFGGYLGIPAQIYFKKGVAISFLVLPLVTADVESDAYQAQRYVLYGAPFILGAAGGLYGSGLYIYDSLSSYCYTLKNRFGD